MRKVTKYRVFTGYGYEDKIYILDISWINAEIYSAEVSNEKIIVKCNDSIYNTDIINATWKILYSYSKKGPALLLHW